MSAIGCMDERSDAQSGSMLYQMKPAQDSHGISTRFFLPQGLP